MTDTGKNYVAVKVFDDGCDVCLHMSKHDRAVFDEFEEIHYTESLLDNLIDHGNDMTKLRVYKTLERHAVNPDYTIDLPVYVIFSKTGEYKGHHVGAATVVELREVIKEALGDTT